MSAPRPDTLLQRFEVDPRAERSLARLRACAAAIAGTSAVALLCATLPFAILLVALLGLLVSLAWLAKARSLARRAEAGANYFLSLHRHGLELAEGPRRIWVDWEDVTAIDVDEEALDIVVERGEAEPVRVEPRYPGVEIHELMHTLKRAWFDRRAPGDVGAHRAG